MRTAGGSMVRRARLTNVGACTLTLAIDGWIFVAICSRDLSRKAFKYRGMMVDAELDGDTVTAVWL